MISRIIKPNTPEITSIIEGCGCGRICAEAEGLVQAKASLREEEAIIGEAAIGLSQKARVHPERYRYIADYVTLLVCYYNLKHPIIMDFGCGPGILTTMIANRIPGAKVVGVDLSKDMLSQAQLSAQEDGVGQKVEMIHFDIKCFYGSAPELADIVVSRNMLHRLEGLEEGLLAMARATKARGGIVLNISYRNLNDLGLSGQERWVADFYQREDSNSAHQKSWILACLNAPTLRQYKVAAKRVAYRIDAEELRVWTDKLNEVNIFLKKKA